jgi:diguanylate cyclase (GGDEF)-like protein
MDSTDRIDTPQARARRKGAVVAVVLTMVVTLWTTGRDARAAAFVTEPPAIAALRADQTKSAAELREQALAMRDAAGNRVTQAWANLALAEFENDLENAEPALTLIDEVLREADALALADLRFAALTRQGVILVNRGRSAETDATLELMKQMADTSGNRAWHAQWLHDRGVLERKLGRFDAARDYFQQARDVLGELQDDAGVARELNSIGMLDGRTGRFSDAVVTHGEALRLSRKAGDKGEIARSLRLLGVLYRNLDDEELASRYMTEALGYVEERNRREAISLHGDLAKSLSLLDRMAEAEHHAQQAVTLAEISGSPPNRVNAFTRMAEIRLKQGRLDEAQEWTDRAFESYDTVAIRDQVLLKLTRVQVLAARGETATALREADVLLSDTRKIGDRILERAALDLLSEQQLLAGDAANAFVTRKAHQALDKELAIDVAARRIAVLEASLDKERADAERELLERDHSIQSLTLNRQRLLGGLLLIGVVTLAVIAFLLLGRYRSAERSRREISASRDELARLHQALIDSSAALERVAHTDSLTGLANRRAIAKRLDDALTRTQGIVSVLILDLDHFKQVNDRHGHLAGDAVLREVAERMRSCLPPDAAIGRWGGEEFIAVLTGRPPQDAVSLAERMRMALAAAPVVYENDSIPISASIGVASSPELNPTSLDELLAAADSALYRVKRSGRNRVEAAAPAANASS